MMRMKRKGRDLGGWDTRWVGGEGDTSELDDHRLDPIRESDALAEANAHPSDTRAPRAEHTYQVGVLRKEEAGARTLYISSDGVLQETVYWDTSGLGLSKVYTDRTSNLPRRP